MKKYKYHSLRIEITDWKIQSMFLAFYVNGFQFTPKIPANFRPFFVRNIFYKPTDLSYYLKGL